MTIAWDTFTPWASLIGGLLIGLIEAFWAAYLWAEYKDVATFAILILVLIFLPTGLLGRTPHHVAGGVLQEDERCAGLVAQLDELRGLGAAVGLDGAVVADEADAVALQLRVPADGVAGIRGLEPGPGRHGRFPARRRGRVCACR